MADCIWTAFESKGGYPTLSQRCQMRFRVAPRLDELVQVRFTFLECDIGQLAPKQLVPQPNAIGVDDISFTIISDLLDLAIEKVSLDLGAAEIGFVGSAVASRTAWVENRSGVAGLAESRPMA
jgi:hypothetical protein